MSSQTLVATSDYSTFLVASDEAVSTKALKTVALVAPFDLF